MPHAGNANRYAAHWLNVGESEIVMYKANVEGTYDIEWESLEKMAEGMKKFNNPPFSLRYEFSTLPDGRVQLDYVKMKGTRFAGDWRQAFLSPEDAETLRNLLAA